MISRRSVKMVRMQFFAAILCVFVAFRWTEADVLPPYIGDLLTGDIRLAVQNILFESSGEVLEIVPPNTKINYPKFLNSISALPNQTNLIDVLQAACAQTSVDAHQQFEPIYPKDLSEVAIQKTRVLQFLDEFFPSDTTCTSFGPLTLVIHYMAIEPIRRALVVYLNQF